MAKLTGTRPPADPAEATREQEAGNLAMAGGDAALGGDVQPDPTRDVGAPHDPSRPDRADLPGHPPRSARGDAEQRGPSRDPEIDPQGVGGGRER